MSKLQIPHISTETHNFYAFWETVKGKFETDEIILDSENLEDAVFELISEMDAHERAEKRSFALTSIEDYSHIDDSLTVNIDGLFIPEDDELNEAILVEATIIANKI